MYSNKVDWIFRQHADTNHMYDKYLPYSFHLNMAHTAYNEFSCIIDSVFTQGNDDLKESISMAVLGHDLIEDTRVSYNDVKKVLGQSVADIIYAVTNDKGKNRSERAGEKYYAGIRAERGAVFTKLCDRIANVRYGKLTKSNMPDMYQKENESFCKSLGRGVNEEAVLCEPMFQYLESLFKKSL